MSVKRCEYCYENLDFLYYDNEADVTFCHACRYEYIKSLSYSSLWSLAERAGVLNEIYIPESE